MGTNIIESSRHLWDEVANDYHKHLEASKDPFQDLRNAPKLLELFPRGNYQSVLDTGCGDGRFTHNLANRKPTWRIIGFDGSRTLVEFARKGAEIKELGNVTFFCHDILQPHPFPNESFTIVLSKMVFPSLVDIRPVVNEAWRILKPNGLFIISTLHQKYYTAYLKKRFENWWYFFQRDKWIDVKSGIITAGKAIADIENIGRMIINNRLAVWTPVAGSNFTVPVYNHWFSEIKEIMTQVGFELVKRQRLSVTKSFASHFREYEKRIGLPLILNMSWQKL